MAIKKYTSGAWVPTNYRKYGTETDSLTSLPAQIIGDGQPITSCQISGNTVQNGTPTPEAPVDVVGCGVRTGNLVDPSVRISSANISSLGRIENDNTYDVGYFPVIQGNTYTIDSYVYAFYNAVPATGSVSYDRQRVVREVGRPSTFTAPITGYCCFRVNHGDSLMANTGSTALPYEPYGYKLPLTVNGTEHPIYLGHVETTRRIRKLVLTGEEDWVYRSGSPPNVFFIEFVNAIFINNHGLCTHYPNQDSGNFDLLEDKHVLIRNSVSGTKAYLGLRDSSFKHGVPGVSELRAYLAAQYSAGTPVTVWYVLAESETGIVNEPLMKIGGYADKVTATNIPTTGTPENFDVGTTLKPSEVQLTYHGWHEHADTKYMQGE